MVKRFQDVGIEWEEWGYANSPGPNFARSSRDEAAWDVWVKILQEAKVGQFKGMRQLIDIYNNSEDPVLIGLCAMLLGDAGTPECFDFITGSLSSVEGNETAQEYVDILTARGRLSDVPLMVKTYERFADGDDPEFFAYDLAEILSSDLDFVDNPDEFDSPAEYTAAVLEKYHDVAAALGGDKYYAFRGALFNVIDVAHGVIHALREPDDFIPSLWRRKFEASTGIDCSLFYKDRILQPLVATAIIEEFLDSPAAAHFKPGIRYFFGHRLPD